MNRAPGCKRLFVLGCFMLAACVPAPAQQAAASAVAASVQHGINLAEAGDCREALPLLKRGAPHVSGTAFRYHARMALIRCAMAVDDEKAAADNLLDLSREQPDNPEVLYIQTHFFSELGMRAARRLEQRDPDSYQAKRLQAESYESKKQYQQAAAIYHEILKKHPDVPGIHYHLGLIALAEAGPSGSTDAAKAQFEEETEVDPTNAAADFVLGELDRRSGDFAGAIPYFARATKLDAGFSEAYLALGMSLAASGKYADAEAPLERYVQLEPDDPAGHYQLAIVYARTGDKQAAERQMSLQKQAAATKSVTNNTQGHSVSQ